MRGKAHLLACWGCFCGITPAYAGKRTFAFLMYPPFGDHPRICGEKDKVNEDDAAEWGSPPHMRGKVEAEEEQAGLQGITPAYAGKRRRICIQLSNV